VRRIARLLLIAFIESFAATCVQRGVYFYSTEALKFSDADNLWLALAFGAVYVLGALSSHRLSVRLKEKSLLALSIGGQLVIHLVMALWSGRELPGLAGVIFVGCALLGFANGIKWPLVESYISAGWTPAEQARAIGLFNVSWATALPLALAATGGIVARAPAVLFLLPGVLNAVCLWLIRPLPARPVHLPRDHPERPPAGQMVRFRSLLAASRWLMLWSYSLLWILAALMPRILRDVSFSVESASGLSGLMDLLRLSAFVALGLWSGWHYRACPLLVAAGALPAGFLMVLSGFSAPVVLAGEMVFGFSAGLVYYSALYYAMVVKNAAVDAGGAHESLIGTGFAVGPAAGLVGLALMPVFNDKVAGILVGVGPVMALCAAGALWQIAKAGRPIDK
jgi:MFS family permease